MQTLIPLSQDTALHLTTGRYFTPSGRSVQEDGIEPDIEVAQLSDPDVSARMRLREADLRNHLVNERSGGERPEENDSKADPRQIGDAESLKKQNISDYQLDYALKLLRRIGSAEAAGPRRANRPARAGRHARP